MSEAAWLAEVPLRRLAEPDLELRVPLPPGDHALVGVGAEVAAGDPLVEHLLDPRAEDVAVGGGDDAPGPVPGARWTALVARGRGPGEPVEGELLAPAPGSPGRWRLATGTVRDLIVAPAPGTVVEVRPGAELRLRCHGLGLRGALAAGTPATGRLELATDPYGELRPGGIDVARAGSILVVGSRIDAEALSRARAIGVRGIVVASLPGKDLRDFVASERRQQAALHPMPPFGVLVLDGAIRRPIASPVATLLERLAGREVGLLTDPPALVFPRDAVRVPAVPRDWVRVRHGAAAGREGRLAGPAGPRRFGAGVMLEAATVALEDGTAAVVPLADLERLA